MINLIKQYINNLNKNELEIILLKKDIHLNNNELDYIYNQIKNNWYSFLYEDNKSILEDIKNNISKENYDKLYTWYKWAKENYSI